MDTIYLKINIFPYPVPALGSLPTIVAAQLCTKQLKIANTDKMDKHVYHCYTSAHGSGRRYYILLLKFLSFFSFFFSFAKGSPRWLYRQGTFIAQMVGYSVILKIGSKIWGATPIKILGPQSPNVVNQTRRTWTKLILGIGRENEYPNLVSKFWGVPQKKFWGGSKFRNFDIETGIAQGSRVTRTSSFYTW